MNRNLNSNALKIEPPIANLLLFETTSFTLSGGVPPYYRLDSGEQIEDPNNVVFEGSLIPLTFSFEIRDSIGEKVFSVIDVNAQPGTIDRTFGDKGNLSYSFTTGSEFTEHLAVDEQDRLYATSFADVGGVAAVTLSRFSSAGQIDPSFANGGVKFLNTTGYSYSCGIHLDQNGKILVVRHSVTDSKFIIAKLNSDGAYDSTYGLNGESAIIHTAEICESTLQTDGKVVIVSYDFNSKSIFIWRISADGSLDSGFGNNGFQSIGFPVQPTPRAIAIDPNGQIKILGSTQNSLFVANLDQSGNPSTANPVQNIPIVGNARDLKVHNGNLFALGTLWPGVNLAKGIWIAKFQSSGDLDLSFGNQGVATYQTEFNDFLADQLEIDSLGNMIVAASGKKLGVTDSSDAIIYRFNQNGVVDSAFGDGGRRIYSLEPSHDEFLGDLVIQSDRRVIFSGSTRLNNPSTNNLYEPFVLRIWP